MKIENGLRGGGGTGSFGRKWREVKIVAVRSANGFGKTQRGINSFRRNELRPLFRSGNVLDLWAAVQHLQLYEATLHLAETFHLPRN
jgi:hypothetical protein